LNADGNTISAASPGLGPSPNSILAGEQFYVNGVSICGDNGTPRGCVNDSWKNIQPRLGFAYDISGNGKTVIRGGYAIMNERVQGNDVYNNAGTVPLSASIDFKNVLLSDPKENVLSGAAPATSIPINNVTGLNLNDYAAPRSTQFSLGVQRSLGGKSVFSVSYVGSQNRHQNYYTETDLVPYNTLPGYVCAGQTNPACAGIAAPAEPYNFAVTYPGYHSIKMSQDEGNSNYNSIQMSIRGTVKDLTYQAGYTFSHTNDTINSGGSGGDLSAVSDPYLGWRYDYGPSLYDHRQIFFTNFVYDVPLLKHSDNHLAKTIVGGWEISGIISAQSGAPLNITYGGHSVASIVSNAATRANLTGSLSTPHTVGEWYDPTAFSAPAPGTWGTSPVGVVRGPGRDNWNISLFKNFVFSEARGSKLQFRAEVFNIWNHPQLQGDGINGGVVTNIAAGNAGAVTAAYDPRVIQLALKLYF